MFRLLLLALAAGLAACAPDPQLELATAPQGLGVESVTRVQVAGDVYHYSFVIRVGVTPNARLRIHRVVRERAPWIPRRTTGAAMLLHGDFATFTSNFAATPGGLAPWLAERNLDVWGADRRFTLAPEDGADLSDFADMGVEQELDDIGTALAFARGARLLGDGSVERFHLIGFSRGGELAYFYAAREGGLAPATRHVKGLVPLDVYVSLAPEDEELRQFFCRNARDQYDALAAGFADSPNTFQLETGRGMLADPDGPHVFFPRLTNREVMLWLMGRTFDFFPASPRYHLLAPVLDGDTVTGLRLTAEDAAVRWLASSPPHSSMREGADTDALTCGDAPLPADLPLSRIDVPLLAIAAAGGYGEHARHSTTQVSSTDVTMIVIRQLSVEREAEDFGHGDLLYAPDAPALAWQPLLAWLRRH